MWLTTSWFTGVNCPVSSSSLNFPRHSRIWGLHLCLDIRQMSCVSESWLTITGNTNCASKYVIWKEYGCKMNDNDQFCRPRVNRIAEENGQERGRGEKEERWKEERNFGAITCMLLLIWRATEHSRRVCRTNPITVGRESCTTWRSTLSELSSTNVSS